LLYVFDTFWWAAVASNDEGLRERYPNQVKLIIMVSIFPLFPDGVTQ
jgi:hypothetical protein